jgi:transcriptional regulator with XRE-family HTH domain
VTFGARLRQLRQLHGLKQKDLAVLLGLSSDAVSKLERDERNPTTETLQKLSGKDIFDVSIDYLLGKTNIPTNNVEQAIVNDIGVNIDDMDKKIDELIERHGILLNDGERYSKEELEKILKHYFMMVNALKDINS